MVKTIREIAVVGISSIAALSDEDPHAIGTTAAEGTAVDASRHDHVHALGADCINSGDLVADDVIGSEHIEALSAALDFNGQQATSLVIQQSNGEPAAIYPGMIYQDTGDSNKLKLVITTS